ncbi:MAG: hypothetical protein ACLPWF_15580 [Bryobacteraceae bacterium]
MLNASLLNRILFQHDAQLGTWYTLNPVVVPNWTGHLILMALVPLLSGPLAERVLIAIYVVSLPLAFRFMLRGLMRDTQGLEFLALPLVYNMHVYWGFYNFCLSLSIYLLLVGVFFRWSHAWTRARLISLAGLALLLYLSHPLMFLFAVLTVTLVTLVRHRTRVSDGIAALWLPAIAFVPSALLYLDYALFRSKRAESILAWPSLRYSASLLFTLAPLNVFGGPERYLTLGFAAFLFGLAGVRLWQLRKKWPAPELLCLTLVGALSVFLMPVTASGGTMITPRLVYLPVFALIAWLAVARIPAPWPGVILVLGMGIAAGIQLARIPIYRNYDRELTELIHSLAPRVHSGDQIAQGNGPAIGPITNSGKKYVPDISPNAIAFLGVDERAMILSNYEAEQDHFPLIFRPDRDPYVQFLQALSGPSRPPEASLSQVDAILFWCNSAGQGNCSTDQLGAAFQREKLAAGPSAARWFVRKTASARDQPGSLEAGDHH